MIKNGHYYYDVRDNLLRHTDCVLFFAVGVRRAGKTYSCTDKAGNDAVKKGVSFIWLRTLENEIELTANTSWFKQLEEKYPSHKFEMKRYHKIKTLFIDDKPRGYFLSIRQWERIKGVKFENIGWIYYDEFLSKTRRKEKNFNPVEAFQGLVHTINERRKGKEAVRAVLLANQITYNNEYFKTFGFEIPYDFNGIFKVKEKHIAVEVVYDEGFAEEQKETEWGKIFMTNTYGAHAIENKSLTIMDGFIIDKKPSNLNLIFVLQYFDSYIYIYEDLDEKMFVEESKTPPPKSKQRLGLRYEDSEKYEIPYFSVYASGAYRNIIMNAINNNQISYVGRDVKEILLGNI